MRTYELVVLLHPDLEIDVDTPIAKIEKLIEGLSGKIIKRDNWGKKRLAYKVNKQDFAIYVYFEVSLPAENTRKLEDAILITEEVMRHLFVTHQPVVEPPVRKPRSTTPAAQPAEAKKVATAATAEEN